jgi:hypothetical protein
MAKQVDLHWISRFSNDSLLETLIVSRQQKIKSKVPVLSGRQQATGFSLHDA